VEQGEQRAKSERCAASSRASTGRRGPGLGWDSKERKQGPGAGDQDSGVERRAFFLNPGSCPLTPLYMYIRSIVFRDGFQQEFSATWGESRESPGLSRKFLGGAEEKPRMLRMARMGVVIRAIRLIRGCLCGCGKMSRGWRIAGRGEAREN
jgi:hypothetical protein